MRPEYSLSSSVSSFFSPSLFLALPRFPLISSSSPSITISSGANMFLGFWWLVYFSSSHRKARLSLLIYNAVCSLHKVISARVSLGVWYFRSKAWFITATVSPQYITYNPSTVTLCVCLEHTVTLFNTKVWMDLFCGSFFFWYRAFFLLLAHPFLGGLSN